MEKYFAIIRWSVEDVQAMRPDWTEKQCVDWGKEHERAFSELLTQYGNECLSCMLDQK